MSRRLHSALREATIGAAAVACAACGVDTGDDSPAGGTLAFVAALESGDAALVWERLSPEVQQVVAGGHAALQATDAEIASLQPSDQSDTRARTGIARFGDIDAPADLLGALVRFDAVPALDADSPYHDGVQPRDVLEVAPGVALVRTDAGQEFEMVAGDDGQWLVREPMLALVTAAVQPIHANHEQVKQAVRMFGVGVDIDDELRRLGLLAAQ